MLLIIVTGVIAGSALASILCSALVKRLEPRYGIGDARATTLGVVPAYISAFLAFFVSSHYAPAPLSDVSGVNGTTDWMRHADAYAFMFLIAMLVGVGIGGACVQLVRVARQALELVNLLRSHSG